MEFPKIKVAAVFLILYALDKIHLTLAIARHPPPPHYSFNRSGPTTFVLAQAKRSMMDIDDAGYMYPYDLGRVQDEAPDSKYCMRAL